MIRISKKQIGVGLIALFLVIAAGFVLAITTKSKNQNMDNTQQSGQSQESNVPHTTDLSKVNALMVPPPNSELKVYDDITSSSEKSYLSFATADKRCSFSFGIKSEGQQPGDTLDDMASKFADHMRSQGYQVQIADASPLKLADESDASVKYDFPRKKLLLTVPSAHFQALEYFGAIIRKDGYRLNTLEVCNDKSGQLSQVELDHQLRPITEVLSHIKLRITD